MTQQPPPSDRDTLVFGGQEAAAHDAPEPALTPPAIRAPRSTRSPSRHAARRARDRRRAAQRRSRVKMRAGSEALLAFLILLGLTLLLVDLRTDGSAFAGARSLLAGVIGPLQTGMDRVTDPPTADPALIGENQQLRAELAAAGGDRDRLRELEGLYAITSRDGQRVVGASIVARDPGAVGSMTATIDRGAADGVAVDQAVIAAGGLAGRVVAVSQHTAVISFLTDAGFVVGGALVGSSQAGIVRGTGDPRRLTMDLLDPLASVRVGDAVVSYGSPGQAPFPPGLAVGTVTDIGDPSNAKRTLTLQPTADPTAVTVVAVVQPKGAR